MRYRVFGQHSGPRVSEVILGTGAFGTRWGYGADPDEARHMLDLYLDAGGNFIDTADSYQFGESEALLGEFVKSNRDDLVIGTKYTQGVDPKGSLSVTGNSRKATEQIGRLDEVSAVPLGVPHEMLAIPANRDRIAGGKRAELDAPPHPVR